MNRIIRSVLFVWIIFWGALFIVSLWNGVADPLSLIACLVGLIWWGRIADKGWRP
jgi:hypothetical protein